MAFSGVMQEARKRWFILGVVAVISLAKLYPPLGAKGGPLKPEITVKIVAVSAIFFNSGLSLKTEELWRALGQVKLHLFIQSYTLVLIPIIMALTVKALGWAHILAPEFLNGLLVVGCMPPPVSSAVILTKAVQGNEAAAIFNSAFGSFLGIVVTPVLLLLVVGARTTVPFASIFLQLSMTVIAPLIIGQIARRLTKEWLEKKSLPFGAISSGILLVVIYTTFCDTFSKADSHFSGSAVIRLALIVVLCQCTFISLAYILATLVGAYTRHDIVAIIFCSTHKSLTLGVPILKIVFGSSDHLSSMTLPLLVYHPTQILLGSALVPFLHSWVNNPELLPPTSSRTGTPVIEEP